MLYDHEGVPRVVQKVEASQDNPRFWLDITLFTGATHTVGISALQAVPELAGRHSARLLSAGDLQPLYAALDRLAIAWFFGDRPEPRPNQYYLMGERLKSISND